MPERPGVLVLMGSGETAPTMVEVHRSVVGRFGRGPRALLLDTPYAFQENAADISARARRYFADSVGVKVEVASGSGALIEADWVFSGPGSPTYALDHWRGTEVGAALKARVGSRSGATVLASAAACTVGVAAVPVYEIYKVGAEPHWRDGVDILSSLGLPVVVIPHYDNTEGGTHDTRFCYLGERRLSQMERELPDEVAVLGIDEHTAVEIDLRAETVTVRGRGALTVRRQGAQTEFPTGSTLALAELRELAKGVSGFVPAAPVAQASEEESSSATLAESVQRCESRFDAAAASGDAGALSEAVLELEGEITRWAADTEEDEGGVDQARAVLRHLVARLGGLADLSSPHDRLAPLVDPLVALRGRLRKEGAYDTADAVRDALAEGGVLVEDTPQGPRWTLRS
ncbi:hypothetical protein [Sphaerisporangium rhizosphaerae]|uniref:Cysteinyl-tRNA synthetase n=1 Tax=Sphaerisporangium rhizosphaerae TaxID=2269375 RepID=A0ABW2PDP3_9ACTN